MTHMKMYSELAAWWPLLSAPEEYAEEASFYHQALAEAGGGRIATLLELGSGGGNNASHLKAHYRMTLVDLSEGMLNVSRRLNPECEHLQGDMRTVRLHRKFDAVFVHDAVMYMTTKADLRQAMETVAVHCRAGGVALLAPDFVRENFTPGTDHGGRDGGGRGLRYLEWVWDPDENDSTYLVDYAYMLKEAGGAVTVESERHTEGLFARADWRRWLEAAGFAVKVVPDPFDREAFVGVKPR